jgi:aminodeoxychorismate synthase component I
MPFPTASRVSVPWPFFEPHRTAPFPFFLDRGVEARPSFAGSRPREQLVVNEAGVVRCWRGGGWQQEDGDPVERIATFVERTRAAPATLPAWLQGHALPRTVGYLAYELGAWTDGPARASLEPSPATPAATTIGTPVAVLSVYDEIDAWDPQGGRSARIRFHSSTHGENAPPVAHAPDATAWTATTREKYRLGFDRIRQAIAGGEIYQANLSRRAVFEFGEEAADAYARLREVQPVPYGAFLDFGGFALLSNSPECFLTRSGDRVLTRPIKGTRPRRSDARRDAAEAAALRNDPKEMAEHLMIVDLERSDLGRVARTGSVEVGELAVVESFATVHHMVTDVTATVRDGIDLRALLWATFPGGSITGAPKIRAMQILAEVEGAERGPYTGAIGFFNGGEEFELSIAIRTAVASGGRILYSTGGGIVADSDPDREWDETELKLQALRVALDDAALQPKSPNAAGSATRPAQA